MKLEAGVLAILLVLALSVPVLASPQEEPFPASWMGKHKMVDRFGNLTRVVLVRYVGEERFSEPSGVVTLPDNENQAYALLGCFWNLSNYPAGVPYLINPSTAVKSYGLKEEEVVAAIRRAFENWDEAVGVELYNDSPRVNLRAKASTGWPDRRNVVTWGRLRKGVVAVTYLWYLTDTGELVDADIVFNSYYRWGIDPDGEGSDYQLTGAFDLQDIATHEVGHFTGLDDLYNDNYWAMTMYGYADFGETYKISLERGDVAGARAIYCN